MIAQRRLAPWQVQALQVGRDVLVRMALERYIADLSKLPTSPRGERAISSLRWVG
jgi:hypothetical protein